MFHVIIIFKVIAATVASDPERYNTAFLGKPNEEYCAWILDSEKWGGKLQFSLKEIHLGPHYLED